MARLKQTVVIVITFSCCCFFRATFMSVTLLQYVFLTVPLGTHLGRYRSLLVSSCVLSHALALTSLQAQLSPLISQLSSTSATSPAQTCMQLRGVSTSPCCTFDQQWWRMLTTSCQFSRSILRICTRNMVGLQIFCSMFVLSSYRSQWAILQITCNTYLIQLPNRSQQPSWFHLHTLQKLVKAAALPIRGQPLNCIALRNTFDNMVHYGQ